MSKFSETDYVYNYGDDFSFRRVRAEIHVEKDEMVLKLFPEYQMTPEELSGMLKGYRTDVLDKMNVDLENECMVEMHWDGIVYDVKIKDGIEINRREATA